MSLYTRKCLGSRREPPDRPKANENQLDLHAAQGSQDLPLWEVPTNQIQPVEVIVLLQSDHLAFASSATNTASLSNIWFEPVSSPSSQ
jgi:hypothetical protein